MCLWATGFYQADMVGEAVLNPGGGRVGHSPDLPVMGASKCPTPRIDARPSPTGCPC